MTQASHEEVSCLLMNRTDAVDHFLEGRSILQKLSPGTFVQWMAYGSIYPISARDFLLVTSKEAYDAGDSTGFVLASTSIDEVCEITEIGKDDSVSHSSKHRYSRSQLRLAGYVGVQNEDGSTTLTFLLDMPVEANTPAWLLQILAQYGLTDMLHKIRTVLEQPIKDRLYRPMSWKSERSNAAATVAAMASDLVDASSQQRPPGEHFGGSDRMAEISKMLANIQAREQRMAYRRNTSERVASISPSKKRGVGHVPQSDESKRLTTVDTRASPEICSFASEDSAAPAANRLSRQLSLQVSESDPMSYNGPLSAPSSFAKQFSPQSTTSDGFFTPAGTAATTRRFSGSNESSQMAIARPPRVERSASSSEMASLGYARSSSNEGQKSVAQMMMMMMQQQEDGWQSQSKKVKKKRLSLSGWKAKDSAQQRDVGSPLALPDSDAEVGGSAQRLATASPSPVTPSYEEGGGYRPMPKVGGLFSNSPRDGAAGGSSRFGFRRIRSNSNERGGVERDGPQEPKVKSKFSLSTAAAAASSVPSPMRLPRKRAAFSGRPKEEVDYQAIFRELNKISPARRPDPVFLDVPPRSVLHGRRSRANSTTGVCPAPRPAWKSVDQRDEGRRSVSPATSPAVDVDSGSDRERLSCESEAHRRVRHISSGEEVDSALCYSPDTDVVYKGRGATPASGGIATSSGRRRSVSRELCRDLPRISSEGSLLAAAAAADDEDEDEDEEPACSPVGNQGYADAWQTFFKYIGEVHGAENVRPATKMEMSLDWQLKASKSHTNVFSSSVSGSSWNAIKAVTVMQTSPKSLLSVLIDDSRMSEYDNMFDYAQVICVNCASHTNASF